MFALLFHENMDAFYINISSFPTVIFTVLLLLCIFYWLVAVLGVLDIDALDIDVDADIEGEPNVLGGILIKYSLVGIPFIFVLTIVSFIGWFFSYYIVHFTYGLLPGSLLKYIVGIPVVLLGFYLGIRVAALSAKPLRKLFKEEKSEGVADSFLGQVVTVRTSKVDADYGDAILDDGGAGLILKVRSMDVEFKKGDRVVLIEYFKDINAYRVIAEESFQ